MSERVKKDDSVETLRGIAIVLVVAGHVIGPDATSGMRVADDSPLRHFYYTFLFLRLPLFATIGGFIYALRPVSNWSAFSGYLWAKVRRLLVPMATVGTIEYLARSAVPGLNRQTTLGEIWQIYIYGFDHFWFLQATFTAVLAVAVLDAAKLLGNFRSWGVALAIGCLASLYAPRVALFSFDGTLYLFPSIVLGIGLARFSLLRSKFLIGFALFAFTAGMLFQQITWYSDTFARIERSSAMALLIGFCGMNLAFRYRRNVAALAWLGSFAYPIYLFHIFGTAPGRMLSAALLGGGHSWATFTVSLCFGLALPIVLANMLRHNGPLSALLIGERVRSSMRVVRRSTIYQETPDEPESLRSGVVAIQPCNEAQAEVLRRRASS